MDAKKVIVSIFGAGASVTTYKALMRIVGPQKRFLESVLVAIGSGGIAALVGDRVEAFTKQSLDEIINECANMITKEGKDDVVDVEPKSEEPAETDA